MHPAHQVESGGHNKEANEAIDMLQKQNKVFTSETFGTDFPFYFILAYRLVKLSSVYRSPTVTHFVNHCVFTIEAMEVTAVSRGIKEFINKYAHAVILVPVCMHCLQNTMTIMN